MALSSASLSSRIVSNMGELGSDSAETNSAYNEGIKKLADAIASAVVDEITQNAQVPAGIAVATTGSATAQTGATTSVGSVI